MKTIFGIDLGTTNSCISRLNQGKPEVISIHGSLLVPSVVSFDPAETIVGSRAKNREVLHPETTVSSVKRIMGTSEKIIIQEREYTPEDISSYILEYLKNQAGEICQEEVESVVITVPAYFTDAQRRSTQKAGEAAGLKVERIINEPTAASLFYNHMDSAQRSDKSESLVLVYDLGGGTFDVSVLRLGELSEVLASTGNTRLGGDDFDQAIVNLCLEQIMQNHGTDLRQYRPALARLKDAAEKAKITLSSHPFTTIQETLIPNPANHDIDLSLEITRDEFQSMIFPYLQTTRKEMDRALQEASLSAGDIDSVLLVGGSTRIPAVTALLEEYFGPSCMPPVDPDLSVAKGAAIQGGIISGSHIQQVLIDVNPHTLSTEVLENIENMRLKCVPIIPRNTQIPVTRSELFYTVIPYQRLVRVGVYQGESRVPEENTQIGALDLQLSPSPAGTPVQIEYSYDLNGIIRVRVEQKGYSVKREVDLDSSRQNQMFLVVDMESEPDMEDDFEETPFQEQQTTNYILHKARGILEGLSDEARKNTLSSLIKHYETSLQRDDEDAVDEAEEALVDYMDELQDREE
ncbi:Hsp70 family protein [Desulfonatronospira sp.]|uniref:Hsp70 family protein n=1 Tax=Desulfonatronospira sp. TaxID=1962951 RepID=UPI0025BBEE65|nr:Hsp70 family protein [Desulfonatronospira sp.]